MSSAPSEELLHAMVMREMQQGIRRDGLWAQALVEAEGDPQKAQAAYIRLRLVATRLQIVTRHLNLFHAISTQVEPKKISAIALFGHKINSVLIFRWAEK